MPLEEQAQMLAALRRGRYGALLTLHILLLCARGHTPTEIAWWLFCSRSSVYRTVQASRAGTLRCRVEEDGHLSRPGRTTALTPALRRWLLTLLQVGPRSYGWCRTRWSCAALAAALKAKRHLEVSAETIRRWLHEVGWVWKRAKLVAKDDDPQRTERLARLRWVWEHLRAQEILVFADELAIHRLPKVGCEWMPKGTQVTVMTPGTNAKHYLAGALDPRTGTLLSCDGERKTSGVFLALLNTLEGSYARAKYRRIYVVVDNYTMHKAQAVTQW
jgi:transposase